MTAWENLENEILERDLCIGCGTCAGVCPVDVLEMQFDKYGEYKPVLIGDCIDCDFCDRVCPFLDANPNEDLISQSRFADIEGIKHRTETGYYLETYIGHTVEEKMRWNGASGGLTTWLLCELLNTGAVDKVITVTSNNDPEKLFEFGVYSSESEVRSASKSAYYPIEMSEVIKYINKNNFKYAIVGLPCFLTSIELAKKHHRKIRNRVKFTFGLVCGGIKNKKFPNYLADRFGINKGFNELYFREKDIKQPATDFSFKFKSFSNEEILNFKQDNIHIPWANKWFTPNVCNFCDDVFAETADASFMDAWLPGIQNNPKGTNLVITRNNIINSMLSTSNNINLEPISIDKVIYSQSWIGVVPDKKKELSYRLDYLKKRNKHVIKKRIKLKKPLFFKKKIITLKMEMLTMSKKLYLSFERGEISFNEFEFKMNAYLEEIKKIERYKKNILVPARCIKNIIFKVMKK